MYLSRGTIYIINIFIWSQKDLTRADGSRRKKPFERMAFFKIYFINNIFDLDVLVYQDTILLFFLLLLILKYIPF